MNFVEWTEKLINEQIVKHKNDSSKEGTPNILIVGPGYNPNADPNPNCNVIIPESGKPFDEWISEFRMSEDFVLFDCIILSRVLEHIPVREIDWHVYQLYTIIKDDSDLIVIVPDMPAVCKMMTEEDEKETPNEFLMERLTYELLSEGPHVFDRHAFWSSLNSVKRLLEKEKLFSVNKDDCGMIEIDSTIVPPELLIFAKRV